MINVNSHTIKANAVRLGRGETPAPPIGVRRGKSGNPTYASRVGIVDAAGNVVAEVLYEPEGGLKCGARVFVSTTYPAKPLE